MLTRKRKTRIILLFTCCLILVSGFILRELHEIPASGKPPARTVAYTPAPRPNPYVQSLLTDYQKHIVKVQSQTQTPGVAIAVVKDTSVVYLKSFGLRQVGTTDSLNEHSVFRLASVSKCFAPVLTGLLVEEGILAWDDPVTKYLPDFALKTAEHTSKLTIRHVLSHTTGLPYHTYTNMVEEGMELKEMLALLRDVQLTGEPGTLYSYQNVAYSLIAEIVKSATGKTYEALMAEKIFVPLHMNDASMSYDAILLNKNVARPHHLWKKGWRVTSINKTYYNVPPAGGVNASINDMAMWMQALLGNRENFIKSSTLQEIFRPHVKATSKNRNFRRWIDRADSYYGLGWRVLIFKTDTLLYHGGYVNGYRSELALNPKNKIGICVLSNGPGTLVDNSIPYFFKLYFSQRDSIAYWDNDRAILAEQEKLLKR